MPTDLGTLLRQWRQLRQMSLEITAQRAGVARVTLNRWEIGQFRPRLPELEAVLRALEVTPDQRRQALALLDAPRAMVCLRQEIARETRTDTITATGAGGLLRAMRLRRRLTLEVTAQRLGIHKSTLTRWERGEVWPTSENLHTLCYVLQASGQELVALTGGQIGFVPAAVTTVEALRVALRRILMLAPHDPEEALKDLLFLRLESQVWLLSARPEYALLLAEVRAAYASYLAGIKRYAEAYSWAERARERVTFDSDSLWWRYMALAQASCEVFRGKRAAPKRGLAALRVWLPELRQPDFEAWALGNMAEYALLDGDIEAALHLSAQSCQVVEAKGPLKEIFIRRCDHASLLLAVGLPQRALDAVPAEIGSACDYSDPVALYPAHRTRMALLCAQALSSLQEANAAHEWLQRAYVALETGYLSPRVKSTFRDRADHLAQQF